MSNNKLSGSIPKSLSSLTRLRYLSLSQNKLTGSLPDLSSLKDLEELHVVGNSLSGSIPSWLGSLDLKMLWVAENQFSGKVPQELTQLKNLIELRLSSNNFVGDLPDDIKKTGPWVYVDVDDNCLAGANVEMVSFDGVNQRKTCTGYVPYSAPPNGGGKLSTNTWSSPMLSGAAIAGLVVGCVAVVAVVTGLVGWSKWKNGSAKKEAAAKKGVGNALLGNEMETGAGRSMV
ncbi:hypothetical protein HDU76_008337 [Blyttiomyces sp. JEL0837]|nr:hypothetical protein HDU76_008337 [Blyttiomyces sp. JEL0837]